MVLEAVMICLDNSEWTRNGDYAPTRFQAQQEACVHVANAKLQGNPETVVGVMSMAGKRIEVHLNFTQEAGTVMRAVDDVNLGGKCNFVGALKTAQLALKNRQNKNQRQRVIMFVGSPVSTSKEEFEKLGKVLKKNNVAVDVISFGAEAVDNVDKLESLIKAVDASGNSHLVNVPNGPHQLSDMITSSPIFSDSGSGAPASGAAAPAGAAAGAAAAFGGVDPNLDPELAMVLRMSMEEEKARQAAQAARGAAPASASGSAGAPAQAAAGGVAAMDEDEDALLQQAIAMSMAQDEQERAAAAAAAPAAPATPAKPAAPTAHATPAKDVAMKPADEPDISSALADPDFVNNLLSDVGIQRDELQLADILGTPSTTEEEKKKQEDAKKKGDKDKPK